MKAMRLNYRSPWILLTSIASGVVGASILRLFPFQDVFWVFMGLFSATFLLLVGLVAVVAVRQRRQNSKVIPSAQFAWQNSVEDRLDELERLKRRNMVTADEYAAKRQEILNDL